MIKPRSEALFWSKITMTTDGCWGWTGSINQDGYGKFTVRVEGIRHYLRAHRVAYELAVGPVPDGLVLDHLCRNRACCRPDHLEPVTNAENLRRGAAVRDSCHRGHPWDEANTRMAANGRRTCRACVRLGNARRSSRGVA